MEKDLFFDRDLSWLSFNERVLLEAGKPEVPLLERLRFLSIYSSNLDEFYRVRMPALKALSKIGHDEDDSLDDANKIIQGQQEMFGKLLTTEILPQLKTSGIHMFYNEPFPEEVRTLANQYFFDRVAGYLQLIHIKRKTTGFFPMNNKIYLLVMLAGKNAKEDWMILNIPSDELSRFYSIRRDGVEHILFLDDIIKDNLDKFFTDCTIQGAYTFKITRNAELDIEDEYEGDLALKIEKQISKRDFGLATRVLHEPTMPREVLEDLLACLNVADATVMKGGTYHNLKDLANLPVSRPELCYPAWPAKRFAIDARAQLRDTIAAGDIIVHPPYHAYDTVVRFFNEAALDKDVTGIYITLYRVASESRIGMALINAARNGKKVTVFIELKARFDEENNIRWAKKMKAAGIRIIYSIPGLKVHAKIALIKTKRKGIPASYGLFSTGNFNESTGRFYTDHVLLTAHAGMMQEVERLFLFLKERRRPLLAGEIRFEHLLVAQFNLQNAFIRLIDREIEQARSGQPARIVIKLNNLEEKVLISKLYEASRAGVQVNLIVRSICCLIPGVPGMSENIRVIRIVDRFLEHGRIFLFHNGGNTQVYLGSADWMNRNIYRRIEVCFPVYDEKIRREVIRMIDIQLHDNVQAVTLDNTLRNTPVSRQNADKPVRAQENLAREIAGV